MKLYGLFSITPNIGNNVSYATHVTDAVIPYKTRYEYPYLSAYIRLYIRKGIALLLLDESKGVALQECGINERMKWSGTRECS